MEKCPALVCEPELSCILECVWSRQVDTRNHNTVCLRSNVFQRIKSRGFCFSGIYQKRKPLRDGSVFLELIRNLRAHKHLRTFLETTRLVGSHALKNILWWVRSQYNAVYWCKNKKYGGLDFICRQYLGGRGWKIRGLGGCQPKEKSFQRRSNLLHFDWFWKVMKTNLFIFGKTCTEESFTIGAGHRSVQGAQTS